MIKNDGAMPVKSSPVYRWLWIAAIVLALTIRIIFVFSTSPDDGDGVMYEQLATNLRTTGIYGMDLGQKLPTPLDVRVPGYPVFLAAVTRVFGGGLLPQMLAQAAVDVGTCLLAAVIAAWLVPPEWRKRAALIAMWLAAVCPFLANYTAVALTEVLATFWTTLALAALVAACAGSEYFTWGRAGSSDGAVEATPRGGVPALLSNEWFLGGLAAGIGTMVRPETPLLLVALGVLLIWRWRRTADWGKLARAGALLLVGFVIPLIPWTARNAITLHEFQPITGQYVLLPGEIPSRGFDAWTRTWLVHYRDVYMTAWNVGDQPLNISDLPPSAFDSEQERERVKALYDEYDANCCDFTAEWDAQFGVLARERAARHPFRTYVKIPFERSFVLWFRPRVDLSQYSGEVWPPREQIQEQGGEDFALSMLLGATGILYVVLALAGVARAVARRAEWPSSRLWAIAFLVLFCVVRTAYFTRVTTPEPRYLLECYPALFALGAIFFARPRKIA
jgi:4-amino-4-deoxy-L-arabinose transferase-like glycosyltransferase